MHLLNACTLLWEDRLVLSSQNNGLQCMDSIWVILGTISYSWPSQNCFGISYICDKNLKEFIKQIKNQICYQWIDRILKQTYSRIYQKNKISRKVNNTFSIPLFCKIAQQNIHTYILMFNCIGKYTQLDEIHAASERSSINYLYGKWKISKHTYFLSQYPDTYSCGTILPSPW